MRATAILVSLICFAPPAAGQAATTDTLIENVRGYTWQESALHRFAALRFDRGGRVVATYPADRVPDDDGLERIDGGGATLIPGLIDAHGHVLSLGRARTRIDLVGARSLDDALARVSRYAKAHPQQPWLLGRGWNQELWPDRRFPTAADLDRLGLERPVWLSRIDGHAAWANTQAMKAAGIDRDTPDPPGGRILRDSEGSATGIFVDEAETLITRVIPAPDAAQDRAALRVALRRLASVGLTGVHDAGIDLRTARLYRELAAAGQLPIRIYAMLSEPVFRDFGPPLIDDGTGFLAIQSVKAYLDGALGSRGAALLEPYADSPGNTGLLFSDEARFTELVTEVAEAGFQLNVHAIGDAANHVALNGFAAQGRVSPLRHRIEHAQVIRPADIPRFARLGIVASVQPTHATSDKNMAVDRIGPRRIRGAYAWRSLLDSGATLAAGSDFPVEPEQPLYGLHAAVTRQDRDDRPEGGWYGEQALRPGEALRVFTLDAAYAARQEKHLGSLEPGKRADFVLLDRDIFQGAARDIWRATVRETWVNGVCIYRSPD